MLTITIEKDIIIKEFGTRRLAVDTMTALLGYTPVCRPSCTEEKWLASYEKDIAIIEDIEYTLVSTTESRGELWIGIQ